MNTREQYLVQVMLKCDTDKGVWRNALQWYPSRKSLSHMYVTSREEAESVLAYAYRKWNGEYKYDSEGKRYQAIELSPGVSATIVNTEESDNDMRIVKHEILKRVVSDWEHVEV